MRIKWTMAKKHRFTAEQMAAALTENRGMVFITAKKLGCHHETVQRYINQFPSVQAAQAAARGEMVDESELRLWKAIQREESWAIAFALRTLGKERGYVPQTEQKTLTDHEGLAVLLVEARTALENGHGAPLPGPTSNGSSGPH